MSKPPLRVATGLVGTALLATAAATTVALWPLHEDGVTGTAVEPDYREFGFFVVGPISNEPTREEVRAKGIVLPEDVVADRRQAALTLAAAAALAAAAGTFAQTRAG